MGNLHHLIYQSRALRRFSGAELSRLRDQTQCFNQRAGITGILWYDGRRFLQVLEGPASVVRELFARIRTDCRHAEVQVLANGPIGQRQFQGWDSAVILPPYDLPLPDESCGPTPETLIDTTLLLLLQDFQHTALLETASYRP